MPVFTNNSALAAWSRDTGRPVVLTIGFFDGLHRGHTHLLEQLTLTAQALDAEPVVVTFANSPRGFHQPEREWLYLTLPVEKLLLLGGAGIVNVLLLNYHAGIAQQTAREFLGDLRQALDLRAFVVGYDSRLGSDQVNGRPDYAQLCRELELDLVYVEPVLAGGRPVKSREVRDLIAAGDVETARRLLGHPYLIMEQVCHGKGRGGQRLGVPTANLLLPREKLAPPTGVYACWARTEQGGYPAAVCVMSAQEAHRTVLEREAHLADLPTAEHRVVVEAHLIGFAGDLYGTTLQLDFLAHVRGWEQFDTVDELQARLAEDIRQTMELIQLHHPAKEH